MTINSIPSLCENLDQVESLHNMLKARGQRLLVTGEYTDALRCFQGAHELSLQIQPVHRLARVQKTIHDATISRSNVEHALFNWDKAKCENLDNFDSSKALEAIASFNESLRVIEDPLKECEKAYENKLAFEVFTVKSQYAFLVAKSKDFARSIELFSKPKNEIEKK